MTRKVLFLCTGNSCRSQIAEAVVNHELNDAWQAYSAGTLPAGYTHPKAIKVLDEIGIAHNGESKHVDQFKDLVFDSVITVCDSAAEECPVWLGPGIRQHISFPDPAEATGTEEQVLDVFRTVRDDIHREIITYLKSL
jgi:arsenate reductase